MSSSRSIAGLLLIVLAFSVSRTAVAGPYADDMSKCLVKSASPQDRAMLIKWIFSVMALQPEVAPMASITAQQRDGLDKSAGQLFQRLLVEACKTETQDAIKNEGPQTIEYAFGILGQVAMRGLMTDPAVLGGMKNLNKYFDADKLKALAPQPASK